MRVVYFQQIHVVSHDAREDVTLALTAPPAPALHTTICIVFSAVCHSGTIFFTRHMYTLKFGILTEVEE